jgi:hypothetical protein
MDIDIEISNLGLEHIITLRVIVYLIQSIKIFEKRKKRKKKKHVIFTILLWKY